MPGSQRFHIRLNAPVQGLVTWATEVTLSGGLFPLGEWLNLLFGVAPLAKQGQLICRCSGIDSRRLKKRTLFSCSQVIVASFFAHERCACFRLLFELNLFVLAFPLCIFMFPISVRALKRDDNNYNGIVHGSFSFLMPCLGMVSDETIDQNLDQPVEFSIYFQSSFVSYCEVHSRLPSGLLTSSSFWRTSPEQLVMNTVTSASSSVPVSCRTKDLAVRWRSMNISPMTVRTVRALWAGPALYCYVCQRLGVLLFFSGQFAVGASRENRCLRTLSYVAATCWARHF